MRDVEQFGVSELLTAAVEPLAEARDVFVCKFVGDETENRVEKEPLVGGVCPVTRANNRVRRSGDE